MKKFMKKNNKGFSLVELIVVILIMAIIAVALAPQVMKWVGTSGESTDNNNKATIKGAVSEAVADYIAENGKLAEAKYVYEVHNGKLTGTTGETGDYTVGAVTKGSALGAYIAKTMGDFPEVKAVSGKVFEITITVTNGIDATVDVSADKAGTF